MANPLTTDRLLAALRAEGCTVREYRSWRTHDRDDETGKAFGPVHGVMPHHTASSSLESTLDLCYDGRTGLPGPLCHGVIDKAGTVWLMSAGRANHAGGGDPRVLAAATNEDYGDYPPKTVCHEGEPGAADGNDAFYGFECLNLGDGKDPWPRAQYAAMVRAHAAICRAHDWGAKSVIGHKEWSDWKVDPRGIDMKIFRRDVAACLALPAGRWSGTTTPPEDDMALTTADAKTVWNADFVKAPVEDPANPTWAPSSYLRDTNLRTRDVQQKLAALGSPELTAEQVLALAAAVASAPGLVEALAEAVADKLAARLAE